MPYGIAHAQRIDPEVQALRAILTKPEAEIDLVSVALTINRMMDLGIYSDSVILEGD